MLKAVSTIPISERLYKTKPCNSLLTKGSCLKLKCCYAHSLEELRCAECAFGDLCNKEGCAFKHPKETVEEFRTRIGFIVPVFPEVPITPTNTPVDKPIIPPKNKSPSSPSSSHSSDNEDKLVRVSDFDCFVTWPKSKLNQIDEDEDEDEDNVEIVIDELCKIQKKKLQYNPPLGPVPISLLSEELAIVFCNTAWLMNRERKIIVK